MIRIELSGLTDAEVHFGLQVMRRIMEFVWRHRVDNVEPEGLKAVSLCWAMLCAEQAKRDEGFAQRQKGGREAPSRHPAPAPKRGRTYLATDGYPKEGP